MRLPQTCSPPTTISTVVTRDTRAGPQHHPHQIYIGLVSAALAVPIGRIHPWEIPIFPSSSRFAFVVPAMSSNPIRGIRRKKSSLTEVKIAVLGAPGVGKSALTVRFLTKRYIGEYDHQAETRYKHEVMVDGEPILFEILDTCPKNDEDMPLNDVYNWADALVLVFAITDRRSFNYVMRVKQIMLNTFEMPVVLVANKADMVHLRQVSTEEGEILAKDFECCFSEVAAAEQVGQIAEVFLEVCREVLSVRRKNKQSLLDRMLGGKTAAVKAYARGKSDSALPKE